MSARSCLAILTFFTCLSLSLVAMEGGSNGQGDGSEPSYQQGAMNNAEANNNFIKNSLNNVPASNLVGQKNLGRESADSSLKNKVINLDNFLPKNEKEAELSNKEFLEKAGFKFSGLPPTKKKHYLLEAIEAGEGNGDIRLSSESLQAVLQLLNNNADAHAQKTEKLLQDVQKDIKKGAQKKSSTQGFSVHKDIINATSRKFGTLVALVGAGALYLFAKKLGIA
ncbi:MAG: hypothetical protein M1549_01395 [Candidatus Dependentiae bacterium]|nr:hypothetical protein [Candidatus Dependentiae bacterium]